MAKKSAMTRDPKGSKGKVPSRPENRAIFDGMTKAQQERYLRIRANKGTAAGNQYMTKITGKTPTGPGGRARTAEESKRQVPPQGTPSAPPGSPEEAFRNMNLEQQNRETYEDAGSFYNQMMANAMQYDPRNPAAGYQQGFTDQLNQSRQTVMDQFERTMGPQFQREQQEFNQRMMEQGIDPSSGAYQAQYKAMMDAQNAQRMNAQAEAFKMGGQYQQQGFEQAVAGQRLPFEQWQLGGGDPWKAQYDWMQKSKQAELDRQAAIRQAGISAGAGVRSAQISADASKYAANLNAINQGYGNQQQQPDWRNAAITGLVAGGTRALLT